MEVLRKFFSLMQRIEELSPDIPVVFLGHTYALQPTFDEFQRAASILMERNKADLETGALPQLNICFCNKLVVIKDAMQRPCMEYEVRKIVVSCVNAKNKRLLGIFYHKDTTCFGVNVAGKGLECHLFLCRSKEKAKLAAYNIGKLLAKEYDLAEPCLTENLEEKNISISNVVKNELDYENVAKFFRKNFNPNSCDVSILTTPCDSLSTFMTTTGYDSGRASTIASREYNNISASDSFREHHKKQKNYLSISSSRSWSFKNSKSNNSSRSASFKNAASTSSSRSCSFKNAASASSSRSCSFKNAASANSSRSSSFKNLVQNSNSFREQKATNDTLKRKEELKNTTREKIKYQHSIDDDNVSGSDGDSRTTSSLYISPYDNTASSKIRVIYSSHDSDGDSVSLSDDDSKISKGLLNPQYCYRSTFPTCILEESTEEININRFSSSRESDIIEDEPNVDVILNGADSVSLHKENPTLEDTRLSRNLNTIEDFSNASLSIKRHGEYPNKKSLEITHPLFKESSLINNDANNNDKLTNEKSLVTNLLGVNDLNAYTHLVKMQETDI
nr:serine-rich adhesin for platelets-like [Hydra vulgaris]